MKIRDRKIIITGAGGGIGRVLLAHLLEENCRIVVLGRTEVCPESGVSAGARLSFVNCDLGDADAVESAALRAGEILGTLDVLINLAGVQYLGEHESLTVAQIRKTVEINLVAPMVLTRTLLPAMKQAGGGMVVNVGSTFGSIAFAHFAAYSASKFGLRGFSESLGRELAGSGVEVLYVAPRATRTALNSEKVYQYARAEKMAMDTPEYVAAEIISAIESGGRIRYIGFPEKLFIRVNALFPSLVDRALKKSDETMRRIVRSK